MVLTVLALVLLVQVSPWWVPTHDGTAYLSIARSLASGHGLLMHGRPHLYYAPGYPMAIFPLFVFSPTPFLAISLVQWLLLVVFALGVHAWGRRIVPEHALLLTLIATTNVGVLYYFRRVGPEPLFMPLLIWTSLWMDDLFAPMSKSKFAQRLVLVSLMAGLLCIVRQAGIMLAVGFCALAVWRAVRGQWTPARAAIAIGIVAGVALTATAAVVLYDRATTSSNPGATYSEQVADPGRPLAAQLVEGVRKRIQETGRLMVPGAFKVSAGWSEPGMALFAPVVIAVCSGWWILMRTGSSTIAWTLPFYVALYVIWPFEQGSRFMTPVMPVLWAAVIVLLARTPARARQHLGGILVVLLALGFATSLIYLAGDLQVGRKWNRCWPGVQAMAQRMPKDARVVALNGCGDLPLMLAIERDQYVNEIASNQAVPVDAEFVIAPKAARVPEGFAAVLEDSGYVLLERQAAAIPVKAKQQGAL